MTNESPNEALLEYDGDNQETSVSAPLLICEDVVQNFKVRHGAFHKASVSAVAGVSFEVRRGETLAIVGETGSGKSTLGRAIIGAPPPTRGTVMVGGESLTGPHAISRRRASQLVRMIFQDPMGALDPKWSVAGLVEEPLKVQRDLTPNERRRRIAEALDLVGLSAAVFGTRLPRELSGGQAQRVAIARALISSPDVVICDEPVTALDVSIQAQILRLLFDLKSQLSLTYLLIAHDLAVVRVLADRTATMYLGKFCEIGTTRAVFNNTAHPYTAALLSAIPPRPDSVVDRPRIPLVGEPPSPIHPPSGCRFHTRCSYAQDVCAEVVPQLRALGEGRSVACHFPLVSGN
jgi:oligopeptide/dipeptide ABC transporter ATP-binding protein